MSLLDDLTLGRDDFEEQDPLNLRGAGPIQGYPLEPLVSPFEQPNAAPPEPVGPYEYPVDPDRAQDYKDLQSFSSDTKAAGARATEYEKLASAKSELLTDFENGLMRKHWDSMFHDPDGIEDVPVLNRGKKPVDKWYEELGEQVTLRFGDDQAIHRKFKQLKQRHSALYNDWERADRVGKKARFQHTSMLDTYLSTPEHLREASKSWKEENPGKEPSQKAQKQVLDQTQFEEPSFDPFGMVTNPKKIDPRLQGLNKEQITKKEAEARRRKYRTDYDAKSKEKTLSKNLKKHGWLYSKMAEVAGRSIFLTEDERDHLDLADAAKSGWVKYVGGRPVEEVLDSLGGTEKETVARIIDNVGKAHAQWERVQLAFVSNWREKGYDQAKEVLELERKKWGAVLQVAKEYGLANRVITQGKSTSYWSNVVDEFMAGLKDEDATEIVPELAGLEELTRSDVTEFIKVMQELEEHPESEVMKKYNESSPEGLMESLGYFFVNPEVILPMAARVMSSYGNTYIDNAITTVPAGMGIGLLTGGPRGAISGGALALRANIGLTSGVMEYAQTFTQEMEKEGIDWQNPDIFMKAFTNPELLSRLRNKPMLRSVAVGLTDQVYAGIAGRTNQLVKRPAALKKLPNGLTAFKAELNQGVQASARRRILGGLAELGTGATFGASGEALAQYLTEGGIHDHKAVAAEAMLEMAGPGGWAWALNSGREALSKDLTLEDLTKAEARVLSSNRDESGIVEDIDQNGWKYQRRRFDSANQLISYLESKGKLDTSTAEGYIFARMMGFAGLTGHLQKLGVVISERTPLSEKNTRGGYHKGVIFLNEKALEGRESTASHVLLHEGGHFIQDFMMAPDEAWALYTEALPDEESRKLSYANYLFGRRVTDLSNLSNKELRILNKQFSQASEDTMVAEWITQQMGLALATISGLTTTAEKLNPDIKQKVQTLIEKVIVGDDPAVNQFFPPELGGVQEQASMALLQALGFHPATLEHNRRKFNEQGTFGPGGNREGMYNPTLVDFTGIENFTPQQKEQVAKVANFRSWDDIPQSWKDEAIEIWGGKKAEVPTTVDEGGQVSMDFENVVPAEPAIADLSDPDVQDRIREGDPQARKASPTQEEGQGLDSLAASPEQKPLSSPIKDAFDKATKAPKEDTEKLTPAEKKAQELQDKLKPEKGPLERVGLTKERVEELSKPENQREVAPPPAEVAPLEEGKEPAPGMEWREGEDGKPVLVKKETASKKEQAERKAEEGQREEQAEKRKEDRKRDKEKKQEAKEKAKEKSKEERSPKKAVEKLAEAEKQEVTDVDQQWKDVDADLAKKIKEHSELVAERDSKEYQESRDKDAKQSVDNALTNNWDDFAKRVNRAAKDIEGEGVYPTTARILVKLLKPTATKADIDKPFDELFAGADTFRKFFKNLEDGKLDKSTIDKESKRLEELLEDAFPNLMDSKEIVKNVLMPFGVHQIDRAVFNKLFNIQEAEATGTQQVWEDSEAPVLQKSFAGIGARDKRHKKDGVFTAKHEKIVNDLLEGIDKDTTIHSGAAEGADTAFEAFAEKVGATVVAHTGTFKPKEHRGGLQGNNYKTHSRTELNAADPYLDKADLTLDRKWRDRTEFVKDLFRRNYYQIKDVDQVIAIAPIKDGIVQGGTAWAVQMALDMGKEVYVYDINADKWVHQKGTGTQAAGTQAAGFSPETQAKVDKLTKSWKMGGWFRDHVNDEPAMSGSLKDLIDICLMTTGKMIEKAEELGFEARSAFLKATNPAYPDTDVYHMVAVVKIDGIDYIVDDPQTNFLAAGDRVPMPDQELENVEDILLENFAEAELGIEDASELGGMKLRELVWSEHGDAYDAWFEKNKPMVEGGLQLKDSFDPALIPIETDSLIKNYGKAATEKRTKGEWVPHGRQPEPISHLIDKQAPAGTQAAGRKTYGDKVTTLNDDQIFVFGSNLKGFHGAGSAGYASFGEGGQGNIWRDQRGFGAEALKSKKKGKWNQWGVGEGYQEGTEGASYALPTVTEAGKKRSISKEDLTANIAKLYKYARRTQDREFLVAQSPGKGLNGYEGQEMADMFNAAGPIPDNVIFSDAFQELLTGKQDAGTQDAGNWIKGINISSYESGLGKKLTNFAKIPGSTPATQVITDSKGVEYKTAEEAYQAKKKELPNLSDANVLRLMTAIITAKLKQNPILLDEITSKGGIEFLNESTHNLVKKDGKEVKIPIERGGKDRWTGKDGLFMQALRSAYKNLRGERREITIDEDIGEVGQLVNFTTGQQWDHRKPPEGAYAWRIVEKTGGQDAEFNDNMDAINAQLDELEEMGIYEDGKMDPKNPIWQELSDSVTEENFELIDSLIGNINNSKMALQNQLGKFQGQLRVLEGVPDTRSKGEREVYKDTAHKPQAWKDIEARLNQNVKDKKITQERAMEERNRIRVRWERDTQGAVWNRKKKEWEYKGKPVDKKLLDAYRYDFSTGKWKLNKMALKTASGTKKVLSDGEKKSAAMLKNHIKITEDMLTKLEEFEKANNKPEEFFNEKGEKETAPSKMQRSQKWRDLMAYGRALTMKHQQRLDNPNDWYYGGGIKYRLESVTAAGARQDLNWLDLPVSHLHGGAARNTFSNSFDQHMRTGWRVKKRGSTKKDHFPVKRQYISIEDALGDKYKKQIREMEKVEELPKDVDPAPKEIPVKELVRLITRMQTNGSRNGLLHTKTEPASPKHVISFDQSKRIMSLILSQLESVGQIESNMAVMDMQNRIKHLRDHATESPAERPLGYQKTKLPRDSDGKVVGRSQLYALIDRIQRQRTHESKLSQPMFGANPNDMIIHLLAGSEQKVGMTNYEMMLMLLDHYAEGTERKTRWRHESPPRRHPWKVIDVKSEKAEGERRRRERLKGGMTIPEYREKLNALREEIRSLRVIPDEDYRKKEIKKRQDAIRKLKKEFDSGPRRVDAGEMYTDTSQEVYLSKGKPEETVRFGVETPTQEQLDNIYDFAAGLDVMSHQVDTAETRGDVDFESRKGESRRSKKVTHREKYLPSEFNVTDEEIARPVPEEFDANNKPTWQYKWLFGVGIEKSYDYVKSIIKYLKESKKGKDGAPIGRDLLAKMTDEEKKKKFEEYGLDPDEAFPEVQLLSVPTSKIQDTRFANWHILSPVVVANWLEKHGLANLVSVPWKTKIGTITHGSLAGGWIWETKAINKAITHYGKLTKGMDNVPDAGITASDIASRAKTAFENRLTLFEEQHQAAVNESGKGAESREARAIMREKEQFIDLFGDPTLRKKDGGILEDEDGQPTERRKAAVLGYVQSYAAQWLRKRGAQVGGIVESQQMALGDMMESKSEEMAPSEESGKPENLDDQEAQMEQATAEGDGPDNQSAARMEVEDLSAGQDMSKATDAQDIMEGINPDELDAVADVKSKHKARMQKLANMTATEIKQSKDAFIEGVMGQNLGPTELKKILKIAMSPQQFTGPEMDKLITKKAIEEDVEAGRAKKVGEIIPDVDLRRRLQAFMTKQSAGVALGSELGLATDVPSLMHDRDLLAIRSAMMGGYTKLPESWKRNLGKVYYGFRIAISNQHAALEDMGILINKELFGDRMAPGMDFFDMMGTVIPTFAKTKTASRIFRARYREPLMKSLLEAGYSMEQAGRLYQNLNALTFNHKIRMKLKEARDNAKKILDKSKEQQKRAEKEWANLPEDKKTPELTEAHEKSLEDFKKTQKKQQAEIDAFGEDQYFNDKGEFRPSGISNNEMAEFLRQERKQSRFAKLEKMPADKNALAIWTKMNARTIQVQWETGQITFPEAISLIASSSIAQTPKGLETLVADHLGLLDKDGKFNEKSLNKEDLAEWNKSKKIFEDTFKSEEHKEMVAFAKQHQIPDGYYYAPMRGFENNEHHYEEREDIEDLIGGGLKMGQQGWSAVKTSKISEYSMGRGKGVDRPDPKSAIAHAFAAHDEAVMRGTKQVPGQRMREWYELFLAMHDKKETIEKGGKVEWSKETLNLLKAHHLEKAFKNPRKLKFLWKEFNGIFDYITEKELGITPTKEATRVQNKTHTRKDGTTFTRPVLRKGDYPIPRDSKTVFLVKNKGKLQYVKFKENVKALRMYRELFNMDGFVVPKLIQPVYNTVNTVTRLLANAYTSWSPEFIITNAVKDMLGGLFNLTEDSKTRVKGAVAADLTNYPAIAKAIYNVEKGTAEGTRSLDYANMSKEEAIKKIAPDDWESWFKFFEAHGMRTSFTAPEKLRDAMTQIEHDLKSVDAKGWNLKNLGAKAFEAKMKIVNNGIVRWVEHTNAAVENTMRLVTAKNLLLSTDPNVNFSVQQAVMAGRNITVDFNRKGVISSNIGSLIVFFNAGVQGTIRFFKSVGLRPNATKWAFGIIGVSVLHGVLSRMMTVRDDDDEEGPGNWYDDHPEHRKNTQAIFHFGSEGRHFKIPLPWGPNLLWMVGQKIANVVASEYGLSNKNNGIIENGLQAIGDFHSTVNPVAQSLLVPTAYKPFREISNNENFFGGTISREDNDFAKFDTPGAYRHKFGTKKAFVDLAQWMNEVRGGDKVTPGSLKRWWDENHIGDKEDDLWVAEWSGSDWEHLFNATGGLMRNLSQVFSGVASLAEGSVEWEEDDVNWAQIPFVSKFYGKEPQSSSVYYAYKRLSKRANQAVESIEQKKGNLSPQQYKDFLEANRPYIPLLKMVDNWEKDRKKLTAKITKIEDSKLSPAEKLDRIRPLEKQRVVRMRKILHYAYKHNIDV